MATSPGGTNADRLAARDSSGRCRPPTPIASVSWEYGPASLRALRWCRTHNRAYVVFTECTPQMDWNAVPEQAATAPLDRAPRRWD